MGQFSQARQLDISTPRGDWPITPIMELPRVLFVDADERVLDQCLAAARLHGFEADAVSTAAAAMERIADRRYPIVAADLEQAGISEPSLMEEIRTRSPSSTFIAITYRAALELPRSQALDAAIATVVLKPFELDVLGTALRDAHELYQRRAQRGGKGLDRANVLLIEDNDADAELVTEFLSEVRNARVTRATRIEEAAHALRALTFDFVISDLGLPDAHGLDTVRRLQPLAPDTPLIVLTGIDDEDLAVQAVQHGAQDYLVKGELDAASLRRTLRHAAERKRVYNRLVHMSRHDPLTGVNNRAGLRDRIETTLAKARRRQLPFAVLFIDLDHFKAINDTLGHHAGDAVLLEVAWRISQCVRTSDLVARLGGDEFAVLLDELNPGDVPYVVGERILTSLERPIALPGGDVVVTGSIGVAQYPEVSGSVDDILKAADTAMYLAKRRGRNNIQVVGAVPDEERTRLALVNDLQHALERGELTLHFQPEFTIDRHRVVAYEALLRWNRPGDGLVPPAEFVPLLEENGRIIAVGEWVLERACEQLAQWRTAGWQDLRVSVNLSARQFERPGLVDTVIDCLRRHGLPGRSLELELTESILMGDTQQVKGMLATLRGLGVRIAIDDFGTGYSSLAYLSRFEVDSLKIDRSFIEQVDVDRERSLITSAIVTLGHHLGLEVIAEGVETPEQLAFLSTARCDLVQGFLLGRPAKAEHFNAAVCG
jgi:diguanylate cyclase (GGDEF)-like protein